MDMPPATDTAAAAAAPTEEVPAGDGGPVKVAILVIGSTGDFMPVLAFCLRLRRDAGLRVRAFADEGHCSVLRRLGVDHCPIGEAAEEFLRTDACKRALEQNTMHGVMGAEQARFWEPWTTLLTAGLDEFQPHAIVNAGFSKGVAHRYKMLHDVPCIDLVFSPFVVVPNNTYPPIILSGVPLDPDVPFIQYWVMQITTIVHGLLSSEQAPNDMGVFEPGLESPEQLRLENFSIGEAPEPRLCVFSPALFRAPEYWPASNAEILGRVKLDEAQQGDAFLSGDGDERRRQEELLSGFLAAGEPPVCIGWGSMCVLSARHLTTLAVAALRDAGRRGIVLGGWMGLSPDCLEEDEAAPGAAGLREYCSRSVLFVKSAPHAWLLPRCVCAVTHGGMGSVQASAEAGIPTVVTPILGDQAYNARLVSERGVGVGTAPLVALAAPELAAAIRRCCEEDSEIRAGARRLGEQMAGEDGIGRGVEVLLEFVRSKLRTGVWRREHLARKDAIRACGARDAEQRVSADALLGTAAWTSDLSAKYPALLENHTREAALGEQFGRLAGEQRLWSIKDARCSASAGPGPGAEESGHFLQHTLVEELAREGQMVHVRRLRGIGPAEGWVAEAALERVGDAGAAEQLRGAQDLRIIMHLAGVEHAGALAA